MHSIYFVSSLVRILHKTQRFKWLSRHHVNLFQNAEVIKPLFCPTFRIICTDSRRQGSLSHQFQQNAKYELALCHPAPFLSTKTPDTQYLMPIPKDYKCIEALIKTEDFSQVLRPSLFYYDVNLENSPNPNPFSCVYLYSFEDICKSSLYHAKGRQSLDNVEEVLMGADVKENDTGRPTEQQLLYIIDRLTKCLIGFFEKPHDYSIYHKNIIFQNNIKGVTIKGLTAYIQTMYLLKFYGFVQYARVKVVILKSTHHLDDGSVRVRWRMTGVPRSKVLLNLLKLRTMSWNQFVQTEEEWLDGFSIFKVGTDGLIYKHICDKMIPKDEMEVSKKVDLKSRLLGLFELGPRNPAAGSLNTLIPCYRHQEYSSPCKKVT